MLCLQEEPEAVPDDSPTGRLFRASQKGLTAYRARFSWVIGFQAARFNVRLMLSFCTVGASSLARATPRAMLRAQACRISALWGRRRCWNGGGDQGGGRRGGRGAWSGQAPSRPLCFLFFLLCRKLTSLARRSSVAPSTTPPAGALLFRILLACFSYAYTSFVWPSPYARGSPP